MPRRGDQDSEERFAAFLEALVDVIGHADRASPLRHYCTGLLMQAERKSVEPIAAVTAPSRVAAQHQSLLHFIGQSAWSDEALLAKVRALTLPGPFFNELVRDAPTVGATIRAAVRERLPRM